MDVSNKNDIFENVNIWFFYGHAFFGYCLPIYGLFQNIKFTNLSWQKSFFW